MHLQGNLFLRGASGRSKTEVCVLCWFGNLHKHKSSKCGISCFTISTRGLPFHRTVESILRQREQMDFPEGRKTTLSTKGGFCWGTPFEKGSQFSNPPIPLPTHITSHLPSSSHVSPSHQVGFGASQDFREHPSSYIFWFRNFPQKPTFRWMCRVTYQFLWAMILFWGELREGEEKSLEPPLFRFVFLHAPFIFNRSHQKALFKNPMASDHRKNNLWRQEQKPSVTMIFKILEAVNLGTTFIVRLASPPRIRCVHGSRQTQFQKDEMTLVLERAVSHRERTIGISLGFFVKTQRAETHTQCCRNITRNSSIGITLDRDRRRLHFLFPSKQCERKAEKANEQKMRWVEEVSRVNEQKMRWVEEVSRASSWSTWGLLLTSGRKSNLLQKLVLLVP